jgi:hypothetical protein
MGMADPDIDRHLGIPHAQEYVAATYTPADDRVVDDQAVITAAVVTAAVDVPVVMVTAAGITVTKNSLYGEKGHLGRVALSTLRHLSWPGAFHCRCRQERP